MTTPQLPEAVVAMIAEGFTTAKAYRQFAGLPIQYVSARSGIPVSRLVGIESGVSASDEEIQAIGKALRLPHGILS
ncbi:helix-turn-helix domain-containing protein [Aureimonas glaciei]|uniref:HTH cro/C1-type domain-containing protein n=1 Tax=Aureimonas glaciei TaxID=1776957 RepID=A0A916Y570_9HYPH|nr:helix-turn-helix transcriptional regulator [Aureimonas glaciei]GGD31180.1 hypothetical protein GCM10011335_37760 [Aureimonas glaciei]